jgi:hypothetical protein
MASAGFGLRHSRGVAYHRERPSSSSASGQGRGWVIGRCTCIHAGRRQLHGKSRSSFDAGRSLILTRP